MIGSTSYRSHRSKWNGLRVLRGSGLRVPIVIAVLTVSFTLTLCLRLSLCGAGQCL